MRWADMAGVGGASVLPVSTAQCSLLRSAHGGGVACSSLCSEVSAALHDNYVGRLDLRASRRLRTAHRNDTKPQPQLASCHQRSGPEASSTCPPRDLCSILRRRLNRGTAPSIEFPGSYARPTQFIMANPIARTSVQSQITAPHQFSCNRGTRSLRKHEAARAWSWPVRGARCRCTPSEQPQVARAATDAPSKFRTQKSKIRHRSKNPSRFRHRKKPSQSHRSSSTCPSAASRRGASR